ncbi:hypothetical protein FIU28_18945 [Tardiphaga sp. vice154]|uniref:hypothetical protein n=1 Tax=Tardiphaga sp. vice154 TaxID=2592814 RepID=UPI001163ECEE|nr:hypothetical protein [Tardiphaga sp. vice154]QDM22998.1 hypothetical protein FIU28_18945 [Tardiphaga sp. vice154]
MSFSSPGFIFAFMPVFFTCYFLVPVRWRNGLLMLASLAFYSIDGGVATWVLIASIVFNYVIGLMIDRRSSSLQRTLLLVIGIVLNLIPLLYYKYWNFFISAANDVRGLVNGGPRWRWRISCSRPASRSLPFRACPISSTSFSANAVQPEP